MATPNNTRRSMSTTAPSLIDCSKPDDQILNFLNENHSPEGNPSFSAQVLFDIATNIIGIVSPQPPSSNDAKLGTQHEDFVSPLCLLKSVGFQMSSCTASLSDENISIGSTTENTLIELSKYPLEVKAAVALAAFALEYGDIWHYAHLYGQGDQLTKSVAILKHVPFLTLALEKRKSALEELDICIKCASDVIWYIFELESILVDNDPKDVPALIDVMVSLPVHVYWSIYAIVACTTQINHLINCCDKEVTCDLSGVVTKIKSIRQILVEQHKKCLEELEVATNYRTIARELAMDLNIIKLIKILILSEDKTQKPVVSRRTQVVTTDEFTKAVDGKHVLFFVSRLGNVSKKEVAPLKELYEKFSQKFSQKCEIVWIPIHEGDWNAEEDSVFGNWSSTMPWYVVKHFSSAGRMYLQKEWSYSGSNSAVVVNPRGKLENTNALSLILTYKLNFISFLGVTVETLLSPLAAAVGPDHEADIQKWMGDESTYVFFYGDGTENKSKEFLNQFTIAKRALSISIQITSVKKESGLGKEFWSAMQILFFSLARNSHPEYAYVKRVVNTLLSYGEAKGGWVLVTRGHAVVTCGQLDTIAKSLSKYSEWKQGVKAEVKKSFGDCLTKYHDKVVEKSSANLDCCKIEIAGNGPITLDCPACQDFMDIMLVRYNCCHPRFRAD